MITNFLSNYSDNNNHEDSFAFNACVCTRQVRGWLGSAGCPVGGGFWQELGCYTHGGMGWGAD